MMKNLADNKVSGDLVVSRTLKEAEENYSAVSRENRTPMTDPDNSETETEIFSSSLSRLINEALQTSKTKSLTESDRKEKNEDLESLDTTTCHADTNVCIDTSLNTEKPKKSKRGRPNSCEIVLPDKLIDKNRRFWRKAGFVKSNVKQSST